MDVSAATIMDYRDSKLCASLKNKPNQTHRRSEFILTRRERAGNRTQFRTHHPRSAPATINMQNKPNFRNAKINLRKRDRISQKAKR